MFYKPKFHTKKIVFFAFLLFFTAFFLTFPSYATDTSSTVQQPSGNTASPVDIDAAVGAAFTPSSEVITETQEAPAKAAAVTEADVTDYSAVMFVIGAETLNVRSGPSSDYQKIGTFKLSEEVTVTGKTSNGWYQVTYNGSDGYVASEYLSEQSSFVDASSESASEEALSTEAGTNSEMNSSFQLSSLSDFFTQFSSTKILVLLILIVFVCVIITTFFLLRKKEGEDEDDDDEDDEDDDDEDDDDEDDEDDDEDDEDDDEPISYRRVNAKRLNVSHQKREPSPSPKQKTTVDLTKKASPKPSIQFYQFDTKAEEAESLEEANAKIKKLQAEIEHLKKR